MGAGSAASAALPRERVSVSRLTRMLESEKLLAAALLTPGLVVLVLFYYVAIVQTDDAFSCVHCP